MERNADTGTLICTIHFPLPSAGFFRRKGDVSTSNTTNTTGDDGLTHAAARTGTMKGRCYEGRCFSW